MKTKDPAPGDANQSLDWQALHSRMEKAAQAMAQDLAPSEADQRAVLTARARTLAQEPLPAIQPEAFLEVVAFGLASETYALEATYVREVFPMKDFTPLPGLPPFVLGIVNVYGQILSVIDLKKFFDLPEKGLGPLNQLIILTNEQMTLGILADEIFGLSSLALDAILTPPLTVSGIGAKYLRGVTAERVILLDAGRILSDEKIIIHQRAE
jgi:purine-binding chemotaxis protein CheW